MRCKVDEMESSVQKHAKQIEGMHERLLSLERYSREYNLRFHNVPKSTDEDCVPKVRNILSTQLDMEPEIENAHRVGSRNDDKSFIVHRGIKLSRRSVILRMVFGLQRI